MTASYKCVDHHRILLSSIQIACACVFICVASTIDIIYKTTYYTTNSHFVCIDDFNGNPNGQLTRDAAAQLKKKSLCFSRGSRFSISLSKITQVYINFILVPHLSCCIRSRCSSVLTAYIKSMCDCCLISSLFISLSLLTSRSLYWSFYSS